MPRPSRRLLHLLLVTFILACVVWSGASLVRRLQYERHSLDDVYAYRDTLRSFNWSVIRQNLDSVDAYNDRFALFGMLENYRNQKGVAALVEHPLIDSFGSLTDMYGTERNQSVPLYCLKGDEFPHLYARDGTLVEVLETDSAELVLVHPLGAPDDYYVPLKYLKVLECGQIKKCVFVDVDNQNICSMELCGEQTWCVRSMTYSSTGLERPPYKRSTPLGIFVVAGKAEKMYFPVDGTSRIGGFAPYATRFCGGAYIHGIPVNYPSQRIVESSPTLGTTPRSHRCVRTMTSHAKYIYDWAPKYESLVIVID